MENLDIGNLLIFFGVLMFSAVLHEMAHAGSALYFGDTTARDEGRISLNPIRHIDPIMTILVPIGILLASGFQMIFGGAKAVNIDPTRFRPGVNTKRAMMWISLAGPVTNFILAFICYYLAHQLLESFGGRFRYSLGYDILEKGAWVNVLLGTFNLLPIPPLDGSKIIAGLVSDRLAVMIYKLERYAIVFFVIIILTPIGRYILEPSLWLADQLSTLARALVI
ncbi:MAG: site-2 protease family protein [Acidobacteriota bacterium]|nr:site-2 protease family protein [Acidobacteriota bacterium]